MTEAVSPSRLVTRQTLRWLTASLLPLAAGCGPSPRAIFEPGAWFVLIPSAGGEGPRWLDDGAAEHVAIEEPVHVLRLPAESLLDEQGQPVRPEVARVERAGGTCGACTTPSLTPPLVLRSGDSCPPPVFAEVARLEEDGEPVWLDATAAEEVRAQVRFEMPGACACVEPIGGRAVEDPLSCFLSPLAGYPTAGSLAWADGTVVGYGRDRADLIRPDGLRVEHRDDALPTTVAHRLPLAEPGHALLLSRSGERYAALEVRAGEALELTEVDAADLDDVRTVMASTPEGADALWLALDVDRDPARVCTLAAGRLACSAVPIEGGCASEGLVGFDDGVALGTDGAVLRGSRAALRCVGGVEGVKRVRDFAAVDGRLWICAELDGGGPRQVAVLSATVGASGARVTAEHRLSLSESAAVTHCEVMASSGPEGALVLLDGADLALAFSDGEVRRRSIGPASADPALFPSVPALERLTALDDGGLVAEGRDGSVWRRRGGAAAFERLLGPAHVASPVTALARVGGAMVAFGTADGVLRVSSAAHPPTRCRELDVEVLAPPVEGRAPRGAYPLDERRVWVLSASGSGFAGAVFDVSAARWTEEEVAQPAWSGSTFRAVVDVGAGFGLVVFEEGVYGVDPDGAVTRLELEWTVGPALGLAAGAPPIAPRWRDASGFAGGAWVSGEDAVLRVTRAGSRWRAEAVALGPLLDEEQRRVPTALEAIDAVCAQRFVAGRTVEYTLPLSLDVDVTRTQVSLLELGGACGQGRMCLSGLYEYRHSSRRLLDIARTPDTLWMLIDQLGQDVLARPGVAALYPPSPQAAQIRAFDGGLIAGHRFGHLRAVLERAGP